MNYVNYSTASNIVQKYKTTLSQELIVNEENKNRFEQGRELLAMPTPSSSQLIVNVRYQKQNLFVVLVHPIP